MNGDSWIIVIALGVSSVLLFAFLLAGVQATGVSFWCIPDKYIFFTAAVLVALISFVLYIYIFFSDTGDHTGVKINAYYIITLIGIFLLSWLFFAYKPTVTQIVGMIIVVIGLVLFAVL